MSVAAPSRSLGPRGSRWPRWLSGGAVLWLLRPRGKGCPVGLQTAKQARELGVQVHAYTVDLSKRRSIYEAADRVRAEVGCVSILVNNAGVVAGRRLLDCPDELLERTLLVNCHALFWVRRASFTHTTHDASLYRHEALTKIMQQLFTVLLVGPG
uniref:Uncharacterized protein n=1 Tax=Amphiprion percula TaxID=161767 RepID=A0A3P8TIL7_AMPPE